MMRSQVMLVDNTNQLLLAFSGLVRKLDCKDPTFLSSLFIWIEKAENLLIQNKLPQCAGLSGLKAKILTPTLDSSVRTNRRKLQAKIASEHLYDIQKNLNEAIEKARTNVEQSTDTLSQLFSLLAQSKAENGNHFLYQESEEITAFADRIWHLICHHDQLKASAVQLRSLLSESDIKLLIAREIDLSMFVE